jgi:DNA-binding LytR/AlgR family response regulator
MLKETEALLGEGLHIQVFHRGAAILAALETGAAPFDIIFLDIELGDTTGIAVAEQIRRECTGSVLIFVSAHEEYCKQLFRFNTAAFLSKPIDEAEVKSLLLRVSKELRNPQEVFIYYVKEDMFRTPLADILFFEIKLRKIEMVTKTGTRAFYGKLNEVEARLQHPGFVRIHHSLLVNLDNVERLEQSVLILPDGRRLPLARASQKETRRKIRDYYRYYFKGKP